MVLGVDEVVLVEDMMLRFIGHYSDSELAGGTTYKLRPNILVRYMREIRMGYTCSDHPYRSSRLRKNATSGEDRNL